MRVKVGNNWYDGTEQPVMVELTEQDRKNIANMAKGCDLYCEHPDDIPDEEIRKFMERKNLVDLPGEEAGDGR